MPLFLFIQRAAAAHLLLTGASGEQEVGGSDEWQLRKASPGGEGEHVEVGDCDGKGFGFGMGYSVVSEFGITLLSGMWGVGVGKGSSSFTCIKLKFPLFTSKKKKPEKVMRNTVWKGSSFTH